MTAQCRADELRNQPAYLLLARQPFSRWRRSADPVALTAAGWFGWRILRDLVPRPTVTAAA